MRFDPQHAAEVYLSALSPAARLKAVHYTQGGHWLLLWGWLVSVAACLLIARWGVLRRASDVLQGRRPRPLLTAGLLTALFVLLDDLIELPFEIYRRWWRETLYGLTSQPFLGWLTESLIGLAISLVLASVVGTLVYAAIRRAPKTWPLIGAGLAAVLTALLIVAGPVLIEPIFNTYRPAPPGPVRDAVAELARRAGVPGDKIVIYDGSKQSNRYTANVSGAFGSARVAMSDVMFAKGADVAEVRGVVGHEMGHYKLGHNLASVLVFAGAAAALFFGLQQLFPLIEPWVRTGARTIGDPVGLPTVSIIASTLMLLLTPVLNTTTRTFESQADAFSLRVAQEPDGLAKALVKTVEYRADSPSALEEFIFYDHPSVRRRVERAMAYKAKLLDAAGAPDAKHEGDLHESRKTEKAPGP